MWMLLMISYVQGVPMVSTVQDIYSKTECRELIDIIKPNIKSDNVEYKCVYLPDNS